MGFAEKHGCVEVSSVDPRDTSDLARRSRESSGWRSNRLAAGVLLMDKS